ncbi:MAG: leucine-rich repeat protein, partial [Clostridia bacterium]|nr:leucine-rich repeat protein [Clostridia bacterium]
MRKAKKLLTLLLCITAMLSLCFTLTACMGGGDPGAERPEQTGCENGHSVPEWNTEIPATCTQDGLRRGYCGNCKEWIEETIPATGHTEATVPGTPATCTTPGSTDKVYCSVCDTVITESSVIDAGHVRGELLAYSVFDYKVVLHFDCLVCDDIDTVDCPSLSDESWSMNLVGEDEVYTCQVEGKTVTVTQSLFNISEEGSSYPGEYCTIIGYRGNSTSPTIPSVYNGKPVTKIGSGAFENNTTITSIVLPNSITNIGYDAFKGCTNLTSVTLPNSVTIIGENAFENCANLTSITLSTNLEGIGRAAFHGCAKLAAIELPEGLTDIGESAFAACTSLTELVIPTTLSSVSPDMCSGCTNLVSVTYADADWATKDRESLSFGVQLRTSAFANCTSLKTVSIPAVNIEYGPFSGCDALESLTLKDVAVQGISALGRLFSLDIGLDENDTVPASLTELTIWDSIYFRTIAGLTTLKKLTVCNVDNAVAEAPNLMTCEGLKEVTFRNVRSVSNINQMPNLEKVTVINAEDFIGPTNCPLLTEVNIIGNLNTIKGFRDCASLTTVRFPESIGTYSDEYSIPFRNCPLLETTTENGATYFGSEDN